MPDTFTSLSDLHLPEAASEMIVQASIKKSRIFGTGAMVDVRSIVAPTPSAGDVIVPFWTVPSASAQILDEGSTLEVLKVGGGKQKSPVLGRAFVLGSTDLSVVMSGADPVRALVDRLGEMWGPEYDRAAIASMLGFTSGTSSGASMAGNVLDISGASGEAAYLDADSAIDAAGLLGEDADALAFAIMHPSVRDWLKKQDLIATFLPSEGGGPVTLYQDKRVIVTNQATVTGAGADRVFRTMFVGAGAIGFAQADAKVPLETERRAAAGGGQEVVYSRNHFFCHPFGAAWQPGNGVPAKDSPSDAELGAGANWRRVYEGQNVRLATCVHKIG
jgi:hypothetical protein